MNNWKIVIGTVAGGLILVGVMVWGLSRMGRQDGLEVPVEKLVDGAGWIHETCGQITQSEQLASKRSVPMSDFSDEKHCDYKVTVVEFADLQCSACRQVEPVVKELRRMDGVRYVFRYFPLLTIHKNAWRAAKATEAAKKMGKGWEMRELLFDKQSEWEGENKFDDLVVDYVKDLGLNGEKFKELYIDEGIDRQVVEDNALASELKLSGTPTLFVEGKQVASNFVLAKVKQLLMEK